MFYKLKKKVKGQSYICRRKCKERERSDRSFRHNTENEKELVLSALVLTTCDLKRFEVSVTSRHSGISESSRKEAFKVQKESDVSASTR